MAFAREMNVNGELGILWFGAVVKMREIKLPSEVPGRRLLPFGSRRRGVLDPASVDAFFVLAHAAFRIGFPEPPRARRLP